MYKLAIGLIGFDKTIVNAIRKSGMAAEVWVAARTEKACRAALKLDCEAVVDFSHLLPRTDVIILRGRPSRMAHVCETLKNAGTLPPTAIIVSVAMTVPTTAIEQAIGSSNAVIRVTRSGLRRIRQDTLVITAGQTATNVETGIVRQIFGKWGARVESPKKRRRSKTIVFHPAM